jgi:LmbE family N-acetylglucosaminyl deacetylase
VRLEEALTRGLVVIVAAHPDDEIVGAGGLLARMQQPVILEVTDGAPRNLTDARRAGYDTREDYARARKQELLNALELAGIEPERVRPLGFIDQESSFEMSAVALRVFELLKELQPRAVLTHPYEGGHPDHDTTAFAVHAACMLLPSPPRNYEFASYHALPGSPGAIEVGRFLLGEDPGEVVTLSNEDRERKAQMIDCFASQQQMLRQFPVDLERYRSAPVYDFTQPPHPGTLFYENFDWGITGERWRFLAALALRELGIPETV